MKKAKLLIPAVVTAVFTLLNAFAAVYFTPSSSPIYNSDGVSQSKSVTASPIGGNIVFKTYGGLEKGDGMFSGAVFDGSRVWLVPLGSPFAASVTGAGEIQTYSVPASGGMSYWGGAYDGRYIYFAPYDAEYILQLDPETAEFTELADYSTGARHYKGAVFDGEYIWFIPSDSQAVLCMDSLGVIKEYGIPFDIPRINAFSGGIAAHENIYFIPDSYRERIVVLNRNTGEFSSVDVPVDEPYSGGVFDGETVYFIPRSKGCILALNCETGETVKSEMGKAVPDDARFAGGAFDGRFIWLCPLDGGVVLSYDIFEDEYMLYKLENGTDRYFSGCFDSDNIWFAPYSASSPLCISGDNTPPSAMNIFLSTTTDSQIASELDVSDEDSGDGITFHIVKEGTLGLLSLESDTGKFTYTPNGSAGTDTFYYSASDGKNNSNTASVTVNILEAGNIETGRYIDLWGHWAETAANYLTDSSVLLGENVDDFYYFYPDHTVTRAEFAVWANSAFGYQGSMEDGALPFEDTKNAPAWIKMAASGAYHSKMMSGFPENGGLYFKPNESLTRAEAMTVLYNVIKPSEAADEPLTFSDRDSFPDYAVGVFKSLKQIGMLRGYEDNTVRPYNKVTRAEAAQLLYEALRYMENNDGTRERLK